MQNIMEDIQKLQALQSMAHGQGGTDSAFMQGIPPMVDRTPNFAMTGEHQVPHPAQQPHAPRSPLSHGSENAIEAAKRSLEMNDSEKRRALGRAILNFSSAMSQNAPAPNTGIAGALGMINSGFLPAVNAYDAESDRISKLNFLLQQEKKEEERYLRKEAAERERQLHEMNIAKQNLELNKNYLELNRQKMEHKKGEMTLNDEELMSEGITPMSQLKTAQERIQARKHIATYEKMGNASRDMVEKTEYVKNILENNPQLAEHWGIIAQGALTDNPSYVRQKLNSWFVPKEVQHDAALLSKTLNDIVMTKIEGLPSGIRPSIFLEKQIKSSLASPTQPASAIIEIMDRTRKHALEDYEDAVKVSEYGRRGGVYYPELRKLEEKSMHEQKVFPMDDRAARIQQLQQEYLNAPE